MRAVELPVPRGASATFHGRDVFAPAAAALSRGASVDALGQEASSPIVHRTPEPTRRPDGSIEGEVIVVDRFGNAVTNLIGRRGGALEVGAHRVVLHGTYAEGAPGEAMGVVGSTGFIEIAVRDGNAATSLGLSRGARVVLHPGEIVAR
jgi:S-adenosylmethionine hydrolase